MQHSPSDSWMYCYWHHPPSSVGQAAASTLVTLLRGPSAVKQHRARGWGNWTTQSYHRHWRADGKHTQSAVKPQWRCSLCLSMGCFCCTFISSISSHLTHFVPAIKLPLLRVSLMRTYKHTHTAGIIATQFFQWQYSSGRLLYLDLYSNH